MYKSVLGGVEHPGFFCLCPASDMDFSVEHYEIEKKIIQKTVLKMQYREFSYKKKEVESSLYAKFSVRKDICLKQIH